MKRKLITLVALAATLALCAVAAHAEGTATPVAKHRQVRQQRRIAQGVKSGQLTPHETARLEHGQAHVARVEARAKADGNVTPAERAHIQHAQNVQSRRIYRAKHNQRTATPKPTAQGNETH
jgi:uncharacterized membrane protein YebE (DUF533 family)